MTQVEFQYCTRANIDFIFSTSIFRTVASCGDKTIHGGKVEFPGNV